MEKEIIQMSDTRSILLRLSDAFPKIKSSDILGMLDYLGYSSEDATRNDPPTIQIGITDYYLPIDLIGYLEQIKPEKPDIDWE